MTPATVKSIFGKMNSLDKALIFVFVISVIVSLISLFRGILGGSEVQVEYLEVGKNSNNEASRSVEPKFVVDIEGAVVSPGVYSLPSDARIKDVLVLAGGFSAKADRSFCEKNLNLAQPLKDGQKIFIPEVTDTPTIPGYVEAKTTQNMVNVNTATVSELDTLWGVGPARAETIVKNRPYGSLDELVSKGGMTKQIFEKNKEMISLY